MKKVIFALILTTPLSISSLSYASSTFLSMDIPESHPLVVDLKRDIQFENQYLMTLIHNNAMPIEKAQFIEAKIQGLQSDMKTAFNNESDAVSEKKLQQFKLEELAIRQDLKLDIHQSLQDTSKTNSSSSKE